MDDRDFPDRLTDRLAALPTVRAVALGGSRAQGTHRPDSDWDMAVHYRGEFDPDLAVSGRIPLGRRRRRSALHRAGEPSVTPIRGFL